IPFFMKKIPIFITLFSLLFTVQNALAEDFPDVTDQTDYAEAIHWSVEEGITQGYEDGNWGPEDCLTRAQLSKMLLEYRLGEKAHYWMDNPEGSVDFTDVLEKEWFTRYIRHAQF